MARNPGIFATAVCCAIVSAAALAAQDTLGSQGPSSVPGMTRHLMPSPLQGIHTQDQQQYAQQQQPQRVSRLDASAQHPAPLELDAAEFTAGQRQQGEPGSLINNQQPQQQSQDGDHLQNFDFDLDYPADTDPKLQSLALRKLLQDDPSSEEDITDPAEPVCAYYSNEVNNYVSQGWRVKFTQFATPEKCPESCQVDYRGPPSGTYNMQCNALKCFCTFSEGDRHYRNVVMKESGALSIVGALPAGCPKEDCVGGGFEFCQDC